MLIKELVSILSKMDQELEIFVHCGYNNLDIPNIRTYVVDDEPEYAVIDVEKRKLR